MLGILYDMTILKALFFFSIFLWILIIFIKVLYLAFKAEHIYIKVRKQKEEFDHSIGKFIRKENFWEQKIDSIILTIKENLKRHEKYIGSHIIKWILDNPQVSMDDAALENKIYQYNNTIWGELDRKLTYFSSVAPSAGFLGTLIGMFFALNDFTLSHEKFLFVSGIATSLLTSIGGVITCEIGKRFHHKYIEPAMEEEFYYLKEISCYFRIILKNTKKNKVETEKKALFPQENISPTKIVNLEVQTIKERKKEKPVCTK